MTTPRVQQNTVVTITYHIENELGEVVEQIDMPISYVQGAGRLFEKVEKALAGCAPGETVRVTLPPEEAFGEHDPELTFTDDLDNVPPQFRHIDAEVEMQNERGEIKVFRVSSIEDGKLTVDGNHPLAAQTITFSVTVVDIRDATPEEIRSGEPEGGSGVPPVLH